MTNTEKRNIIEAYNSIGSLAFLGFLPTTQRKASFIKYIDEIHANSGRNNELTIDSKFDILEYALEKNPQCDEETLQSAYNTFWEPQIIQLTETSNNNESFFDQYLSSLHYKGWKEENIEKIAIQTSNLIRRTTQLATQLPDKLCTALVVGHVQSGKTSNYCADINYWLSETIKNSGIGYNTFIILTDNNSSLGKQTKNRLRADIMPIKKWAEEFSFDGRGPDVENGTLHAKKHGGFLVIEDNDELWNDRQCQLTLEYNDAHRMFFTPVLETQQENKRCLVYTAIKNKNQIQKLSNGIFNPETTIYHEQMTGVVIIDDEADVITPTITPRGNHGVVRREILSLINKFTAHNLPVAYIAFTATPYANILNVPPSDDKNPLFPHIIQILDTPAEYFGTSRILGRAGDPPKWIHKLAIDEKPIQNDTLSNELKRAFAWFLCTVAARRIKSVDDGKVHPVSMMIHASNLTAVSKQIIAKLEKFAKENKDTILELCRSTWELKTNVTPYDLPVDFPGRLNVEKFDLSFDDIKDEISTLLDHDSSNSNNTFTKGLNFRLLIGKKSTQAAFHYPFTDDEINDSGTYPAFIIVGGNCISRGMTLEGLTSIYFIRNSQYNDTLLQFARWNGYRHGYEILPRIWIKEDLIDLFRKASYMEEITRLKIKNQFNNDVDHWETGVRVYGYPNEGLMPTGKMRAATSNKSSSLNYDTNVVPNNPDIWEKSVIESANFINNLGKIPLPNEDGNYLWYNVNRYLALNYLKEIQQLYPNSESINSLLLNEEILLENNWNVAFIPLRNTQNPSPVREDFGFFSNKSRSERQHELRSNGQFGSKSVHTSFQDYVADVPGSRCQNMTVPEIRNILQNNNKEKDVLILLYLHKTADNWQGINENDKDKTVVLVSVRWICENKNLIYSINLGKDDMELPTYIDIPSADPEQRRIEVESDTYTLAFADEYDDIEDISISCNFTIDENGNYVCTQINENSALNQLAINYLSEKNYQLQLSEENILLATVKLDNIPEQEFARNITGKAPENDEVWWCKLDNDEEKLVQ